MAEISRTYMKSQLKTPLPFLMHPEHPRWEEFAVKLWVELDFDWGDKGVRSKCNMSHSRPSASKILKEMGADVAASLALFEMSGGFCDCEIIINVDLKKCFEEQAKCNQ